MSSLSSGLGLFRVQLLDRAGGLPALYRRLVSLDAERSWASRPKDEQVQAFRALASSAAAYAVAATSASYLAPGWLMEYGEGAKALLKTKVTFMCKAE